MVEAVGAGGTWGICFRRNGRRYVPRTWATKAAADWAYADLLQPYAKEHAWWFVLAVMYCPPPRPRARASKLALLPSPS